MVEKKINFKNLKDGWLYKIHARNASIGIFSEKTGSFYIRRRKFNEIYLFDEYEESVSKDFGTAYAIEEIEQSPFSGDEIENNSKDVLIYLKEKTE